MKSFFTMLLTCLFFAWIALADDITPAASENPPFQPPTEMSKENESPPKKLEGPVFPLEDVIEKPNKQNDKFFAEFLNMLATLGFIIGLILIAAWFLKRLMTSRLEQKNLESSIKIVEQRTLSPKTMLYLLEIRDKIIVVSESHQGVTKLAEFTEHSEQLPAVSQNKFRQMLEKKQEE